MFAQFLFAESKDGVVDRDAILLDSGSTTIIFGAGGKKYLTNFRKVNKGVHSRCNGGVRETSIKANFGSFDVWYDEGAIANILSL